MAVRTWVNGAAPYLEAVTLQAMEKDMGLGAQFCTNSADVAAIPSGSLYVGKMVYRADTDTVYRYVGVGNTALGSTDTTHPWQAWSKPAAAFTPTWTSITIGSSTVLAQYGINAGVAWTAVNVATGASYAISSTTNDVAFTPPTSIVTGLAVGTGFYLRAGSSGNNSLVDLVTYPVGPNGQTANGIRIRAKYVNAAPGPVTENVLGSVITSSTTDSFQLALSAPSALVA